MPHRRVAFAADVDADTKRCDASRCDTRSQDAKNAIGRFSQVRPLMTTKALLRAVAS